MNDHGQPDMALGVAGYYDFIAATRYQNLKDAKDYKQFAKDGICTHASLQLADGKWTSKLGFLNDISHSLHALEGELYGSVVCIMKRPASR